MTEDTIKRIIEKETADGTRVIQLDIKNDILRVEFPNGKQWTLYLSVLADRLSKN